MAYELDMGKDGILRLAFIGDPDEALMQAFLQDFTPLLEAATAEKPLLILADSNRSGRYPSAVRKIFADMNRDPRIGKAAVVGAGRYTRVMTGIILKATRRDNIHFFDTEAEARAWLKE